MTENYPAIGGLPGIDLVTEGIITLSAALNELVKSGGRLDSIPVEYNGVSLLARELLSADAIQFLVGQSINPAYENPLLPRDMSIRRYLVERLAETLKKFHKDVEIEYF